MQPIQGLQNAFSPDSDPLGIAVQQRAKDAAFQRRLENPIGTIGHLFDPQWDTFLQALNEAGGGRPVKFAGGSSPEGSNQLTGFQTPADFSGTESYGGGNHGPSYTGTVPTPYNSGQEGPFGKFGAGTGGIESQPPSNPFRLTEPSAPVAGLQAAAPKKRILGT